MLVLSTDYCGSFQICIEPCSHIRCTQHPPTHTHTHTHTSTPTHTQERMQVYPPPETTEPQLVTLLQVRLLKKLGRNAYPFTFSVSCKTFVLVFVSLSFVFKFSE